MHGICRMAPGGVALYVRVMQLWLTYALYAVIGVVFVVLAFGVFNLVRTDSQARSRSNKLMRLRVVVQFIAVILIVALGLVAGRIHLHG